MQLCAVRDCIVCFSWPFTYAMSIYSTQVSYEVIRKQMAIFRSHMNAQSLSKWLVSGR